MGNSVPKNEVASGGRGVPANVTAVQTTSVSSMRCSNFTRTLQLQSEQHARDVYVCVWGGGGGGYSVPGAIRTGRSPFTVKKGRTHNIGTANNGTACSRLARSLHNSQSRTIGLQLGG